jgi:hypothetical protein
VADYVFNIAKGRMAEFMDRVNSNDPATACFKAIPLSASGSEAAGQDLDTVALVLADAAFTEITTGSWARVQMVDTNVAAASATVNDTDNRMETDMDDIAFGTITSGTATGILICYGIEAGVDSALIPISHHDFAATGVGTTITATIPATGFVWST